MTPTPWGARRWSAIGRMKLNFERGRYEEDRRGWILSLAGQRFLLRLSFTFKRPPGDTTTFFRRRRAQLCYKLKTNAR